MTTLGLKLQTIINDDATDTDSTLVNTISPIAVDYYKIHSYRCQTINNKIKNLNEIITAHSSGFLLMKSYVMSLLLYYNGYFPHIILIIQSKIKLIDIIW